MSLLARPFLHQMRSRSPPGPGPPLSAGGARTVPSAMPTELHYPTRRSGCSLPAADHTRLLIYCLAFKELGAQGLTGRCGSL